MGSLVFSLFSLFAISNFPARRKAAIEKVKRVADALSREVDEAMQMDLSNSIEKLQRFVELVGRPYQDSAQQRLNRLSEIQEELANVENKLKTLKIEIQNLHIS
ncbi:hypothetical protein QJS04_geneDACA016889 [Acorus gramineus]|uniref:Uncharacterized protein n=1 Tax=Acorus gramineus TaxID=55184 RepID=A0AAV9BPZ3_ACOGR|nr:hypothetical protein QJS04_geneDACA016889 [Acorus gramineus]